MAKKKTDKSPNAPTTTVVSVRFSEEELERIKEAAAILEQPPASWVRQAALRASIETINASRTPKQQRAIAELSTQVAKFALCGGGVHITEHHVDKIDPDGTCLTTERKAASFNQDDGLLTVKSAPCPDQVMRNLIRALEYAASPFAASLLDAIEQIQAAAEDDDDQDFIPVITRDSDE